MENAAILSVALVENAIVMLMLVEDHLRLQSKLFSSSHFQAGLKPLEQGNSSKDFEGLSFDVCFHFVLFVEMP